MAVDVPKELRRAVDTGQVRFGLNQAMKSIMQGRALMAIASSNAERYSKEKVEQLCKTAEVPFYCLQETGQEMGSICGKPFVVSFACVEKAGKSRILDAANQKKGK